MADICNSPKGDIVFPNNSGSTRKNLNIEEGISIIEKRKERLEEYVNALVNGDEISQLFIKTELTEKAKKELVELQQATISTQIDTEKENLATLKEQVKELSKKINELKNINETLSQEKELLSTDVSALKDRKEMLIKSINNDLSQVLSSDIVALKEIKTELPTPTEEAGVEKKAGYLPFTPHYMLNDNWDPYPRAHKLFDDDEFTSNPGLGWHI